MSPMQIEYPKCFTLKWKRSRGCGKVDNLRAEISIFGASLFTLIVNLPGVRRRRGQDGGGESGHVSKELNCDCEKNSAFFNDIQVLGAKCSNGSWLEIIRRHFQFRVIQITPSFASESQQLWVTGERQLPLNWFVAFWNQSLPAAVSAVKDGSRLKAFFFFCQQLWHGFSRWQRITIWIFPSTSGEQSCDYWD